MTRLLALLLLLLALPTHAGWSAGIVRTGAVQWVPPGPVITFLGGNHQSGGGTTAVYTTTVAIPSGAIVVAFGSAAVDGSNIAVTSPNLSWTQRGTTATSSEGFQATIWTAVAGSEIASGEVVTNTTQTGSGRNPSVAVWYVTNAASTFTQTGSGVSDTGTDSAWSVSTTASGTAFVIGGATGYARGTSTVDSGTTGDWISDDGTSTVATTAAHSTSTGTGTRSISGDFSGATQWAAAAIAINGQ